MSNYDFNDAEKQGGFELIPAKTVVKAIFNINPGGIGPSGWLTQSKSSDAEMIAVEYIVTEGPHAKSRWWGYLVVSGGKQTPEGQSIAGNISRQTLRAILESSRNIKPDDASPEAGEKRKITGWGDFNGLTFICRVGIEVDKTGRYDDKNKILQIITPDMKEYTASIGGGIPAPAAAPIPQAQATTPPPASNTPAWAQ